jgi:hypothetical protein
MKSNPSMTSNSNAGLGELRVRGGGGCGGSCGGGGVRLGHKNMQRGWTMQMQYVQLHT